MKLRIKGDSLRLRVAPSEVDRLLKEGRVAETIHFAPETDARLTYALESSPDPSLSESVTVRCSGREVTVVVPAAVTKHWAESTEVGIYGQAPVFGGRLEVAVEKDFACLDGNDTENADTFPNPRQGAVC